MVVPPPSVGRITDQRPGPWGANMDNSDLVTGTTLYLPVFVRGALLSIGDGHAAQGHGEVGGSAIETSLKGEIQVILHKGKTLRLPRAETPTEYMTMGFHEDLDEAVKIATREMLDWIVEMKGLPRDEAYLLASAAMDLRVTQVVDGNKGIHAVIAKSIFQSIIEGDPSLVITSSASRKPHPRGRGLELGAAGRPGARCPAETR